MPKDEYLQEETLYTLYHQEYKTLEDISELADCSIEWVRLKMEEHGIERRSRGNNHNYRKRPSDLSDKDLYELHHVDGIPVHVIADNFQVRPETVRRWLKDAGIQVLSRWELKVVDPCAKCGKEGGYGEEEDNRENPVRMDASEYGFDAGKVCHGCWMKMHHKYKNSKVD